MMQVTSAAGERFTIWWDTQQQVPGHIVQRLHVHTTCMQEGKCTIIHGKHNVIRLCRNSTNSFAARVCSRRCGGGARTYHSRRSSKSQCPMCCISTHYSQLCKASAEDGQAGKPRGNALRGIACWAGAMWQGVIR